MKLKKKKRLKRRVPMSDEAMKLMEQQLEKFRQKFGRDPRPEDPVFFDADADMPHLVDREKAEEALLMAMTAAGIAPELIYACLRTGRFVTEENSALLSEDYSSSKTGHPRAGTHKGSQAETVDEPLSEAYEKTQREDCYEQR